MAAQPVASVVLAVMLFFVAVATVPVDGGNSSENDHSGKGNIILESEVNGDLVMDACKNLPRDMFVRKPKIHFDEETCISVLRSDNRSKVAKDHGDLVLVALDLLDRRSNEVALKVDSILSGLKVRNWTEHVFRFCSADYAFMVRTLPACHDIFAELKPLGKHAGYLDNLNAMECIDNSGQAANHCYQWLVKKNYSKTEEFQNIVMHNILAWGLMEIALDYEDKFSKW